MSRLLVLFTLALTVSVPALAQDAQQPPKPPCDPAASYCLGVEGWLLTVRTWTPGGAEPRDLVGARLQAELRHGRWRWAARGDATGIPGEYVQGRWETVRSLETHAATAWDALQLPGGITIGPAGAVGAAVILQRSDPLGLEPKLPKSLTAGLGGRASWPGGWIYVVGGMNQALRGAAVTATWQAAISEHVANVGLVAIGSTNYTATIGIAVRWL